MEPVTYSNRDAKIIKDNPDKSPYELQLLGLSGKGFEKLMTQQDTGGDVIADPSIKDDEPPAQTPSSDLPPAPPEDENKQGEDDLPPAPPVKKPLIPKVTELSPGPPKAKAKLLPNQVMVRTPTGVVNPMGREFAQKLVKADPKYKIIG